jgi:hypothetical protein
VGSFELDDERLFGLSHQFVEHLRFNYLVAAGVSALSAAIGETRPAILFLVRVIVVNDVSGE